MSARCPAPNSTRFTADAAGASSTRMSTCMSLWSRPYEYRLGASLEANSSQPPLSTPGRTASSQVAGMCHAEADLQMPGFRRRHSFVMGVLIGLVIAGLIGIVLVAPIALAHHGAGSLETAYGNIVVSTLARVNAGGVGANPTTANAQSLQQGRQSYTGSCSQCHGTAGHTQGAFGQTSFPPATDLSGPSASALSDGQMFYIIKNGL